jgi:hypothetical protein
VVVLTCNMWVWVCVGECMYGFCNVWGCMCGYSENCVGVLVICILAFTVFCIVCTLFLYCFVYVYLFLFFTSARTTATE